MDVTPEFGMALFLRQDLKKLVAESLDETDRWHKRRAPLAAPMVVFFVLAMAWFRPLSIKRLLKQCFQWMRGIVPELPLSAVTPEAICHARKRLGVEPLKALYRKLAASAKESPRFLGLRVSAIDGVHLTMPDTPANVEEFGKPSVSRGSAAFPQMLAVALVSAGTRLVREVVLTRNDAPERAACKEIVNRLAAEESPADELESADCEQILGRLGAEDLLMMDRGFAAVWLFKVIMDLKVRLLCRISASWKPKILRRLGPGDWLVQVSGPEMSPREAKRKKPEGGVKEIVLTLRMIEYQVGKGERVRLLSSLLDPVRYPAKELAPGYHLRWEGELCYDELKTHLATVNQGTLHTVLRSKSPDGVLQEAYGLFAAYNLVRSLMLEAAEEHDVPPLEISFTEALDLLRNALPEFERAVPADRPRLFRQLLADIAACRLKRPRRPRRFARVIKVKMSNWKLKRPEHRQELVNFALELKLCG
jgi:hypothetical protein